MPLPGAAVALSPWTDLALTGASLTANAEADPMLKAEQGPADPSRVGLKEEYEPEY